jgi:hypothetical protein
MEVVPEETNLVVEERRLEGEIYREREREGMLHDNFVKVGIPINVGCYVLDMENVRFTTPIQQLYNNPSHEGGSHILGPTLM